jgi:HD-like signal output (HDOD) protein/CheY-like chemotaxis protein
MREAISHDAGRAAEVTGEPRAIAAEGSQAPMVHRPAEPPRKKRILFVDDEPDLLESLRDAMHIHRRAWAVTLCSSGAAALQELAQEPADVIVADMQMPQMDGATLLGHVRDLYPTTIRMVLSGYASPQHLTRAAAVAHRFLGKPFDAAELSQLIERSCALRELTEEAEAFRRTAAATSLPSRPGVHGQITTILADPAWEPEQIAMAIESDIAITAKVLQLANSAFFGIGRTVTSVREAVVYLGVETIKSLSLMAEAFGKLAPDELDGFSIDDFQRHAMLVARVAGGILSPGRSQQEAVTAGLLHDIGKLVLIADDAARWRELNDIAVARNVPLHVVEEELEGATHAATGAYLLSLWGLPDGVVEAVAHHHDPSDLPATALDAVAAVHIANALANDIETGAPGRAPSGGLDQDFLAQIGVSAQTPGWYQLAVRCAENLN